MRTFLAASLLILTAPLCVAQSLSADTESGPTTAPKKLISFDVSAIDKTADPCVDFYAYACGNWRKANPIPADQVRWGTFNELADRNNYLLYTELKAAADAPKTPLQKKYGDYFAACMNTAEVDKLGAKPIEPELHAIDSLKSNSDLATLNLEQFKNFGGHSLFGVGVTQDQVDSSKQILATSQGGISLPDRDYYLNPDARFVTIREQYVAHVTKMFTLLGDSPEKAATEAADVMRIETALAKGNMDRVEMRDPAKRYHILTIAELQKLTPLYDWKLYLTGIGKGDVTTIDVTSPGFDTAANAELATESVDALKSYLRWHALHSAATLLSKPFQEENFAFFHSERPEGRAATLEALHPHDR
jgi:putative endopeptidase